MRPFDSKTKSLGAASDVYVNGGRIAAIYPAGSPAGQPATIIEGGGRALLPGLFDMHSHEDAWNAGLQIAGGVTSSRDMGNDNDYLASLMRDIANGDVVGPHIEPAGYHRGREPVCLARRLRRQQRRGSAGRDRLVRAARLPPGQALQLDQAGVG